MAWPPRRYFAVSVLLCMTSATLTAQDTPLVLDEDVNFEPDFGFDADLFAEGFASDASDAPAWLDDFTFKLSQQLSGQVNSHSVELAPGFSLPREAQTETNRFGVNIRYQNAFAPGWLLQGSAQARIYWKEDYEYRANNDRVDTEFRVNEFFLQRSAGQHSVKVGEQTVVWGETVGNSVLDVINTSEFRDLTIIDIEDARLNQLMLVWDFFGEDSTLSSFINLYPEFNPPPVRGSPFFFEPAYNLTDYDRGDKLLFEVGSQWRKSFTGSDIAVMAAYLYENQLRYEDPPSGSGDAVGQKNDFLLLGFSANRALGKLLLAFDLAYSHGVLADSFNFPGTGNLAAPLNLKKNRIGTSFGFEYAISNEQNISLGIQAQKTLNERDGLLPGQTLLNEGVTGSWLLRYSNSLMNGDLVLSSTAQGDLQADSLLLLVGADYTMSDNWSINGQIIGIMASSESLLLYFDADVRLGVTLSYQF